MSPAVHVDERIPYVVVMRYSDGHGEVRDYTRTHHKTLVAAKEAVRRMETAWLRLIGPQWSPLSWHVVDERDYTIHWGSWRPYTEVRSGKANSRKAGDRTGRRARPLGGPGRGWRDW